MPTQRHHSHHQDRCGWQQRLVRGRQYQAAQVGLAPHPGAGCNWLRCQRQPTPPGWWRDYSPGVFILISRNRNATSVHVVNRRVGALLSMAPGPARLELRFWRTASSRGNNNSTKRNSRSVVGTMGTSDYSDSAISFLGNNQETQEPWLPQYGESRDITNGTNPTSPRQALHRSQIGQPSSRGLSAVVAAGRKLSSLS